MCWVSRNLDYIKYNVAEKDIYTFKVMEKKEGIYYSYYFHKEYNLAEEYKNCISIKFRYDKKNKFGGGVLKEMTITEGFHSYSSERCFVRNRVGSKGSWIKVFRKQLLFGKCFEDYVVDSRYHQLVVMDCVIPRGSHYYINDMGEIVSNKIIVVGERKG